MAYGVIYGLLDPRDGKVRYIGQTTQSLQVRLRGHISTRSSRRYSSSWVASLTTAGIKPSIVAIASALDQESLDALEVTVIAEYRQRGEDLTNHSVGGRGGRRGTRHSEEHKLALAERLRNKPIHTPALMARLAEAKIGVPRTKETIAKISESKKGSIPWMQGKRHTLSSMLKLSESQRGNKYRYRSDLKPELVLELVTSGLTLTEIAARLGSNRATIRYRLRQAMTNG